MLFIGEGIAVVVHGQIRHGMPPVFKNALFFRLRAMQVSALIMRQGSTVCDGEPG